MDYNATRAYQVAYPNTKYDAARSSGSTFLTKSNIQAEIKRLNGNLEELLGISRAKVLNEHIKLALSSIAHLHNTWVDRKQFEDLTDDQKSCISEIETRVVKKNIGVRGNPEIVDVEQIKVKLYNKQASLDSISKMLGYNEPEKIDVSSDINVIMPEKLK